MIPQKILRDYIDSDHYRQEITQRWGGRFSDSQLGELVSSIRHLALRQCATSEFSVGTSPKRAIIAYLCGLELSVITQFENRQINNLIFGSDTDRAGEMSVIPFPNQGLFSETMVIWTKDQYQAFVLASTALDLETKEVLNQARQAIDDLKIANAGMKEDLEYATRELNRLVTELAVDQNSKKIKTIWKHIQEVAPTISTILSAIASIAKFLS